MDQTLSSKAQYYRKTIIPSLSREWYDISSHWEPDTLSWLRDPDIFETTRRQERYQSRGNRGYGMHTFPCIFYSKNALKNLSQKKLKKYK